MVKSASVSNFIRGLHCELLCLLEHSLIFLAALLPGRGCFNALRLISRLHSMFVDLNPAAERLQAWLPEHQSREEVLRGLALHRLLDMADFYLTLFRGEGWFERNVRVQGTLPSGPAQDHAAIMCTFHYGQGFWALPAFKQRGWNCAFLHLPPPPVSRVPWGERFAAWLGHKRIAQVERLSGASAIPVGGSVERMRSRFREERQAVLVMPDVPSNPEHPCLEVTLFGRRARFPAGAISLAASEGVPIYLYTMALDRQSGMRHLQVHAPIRGLAPEALAVRIAQCLEQAIRQDPAAWHLWAWIDHFLYSEAQ